MNRLVKLILACGLVGTFVGCNTGTSTAPTPGKPAGDGTRSSATAKLTVTVASSQTVTQDKTDEVKVSVNRDNFSSPVTVSLSDLPKGVSVETKELTLPADKSSLTVTLKAAPDAAPVVDHMVKVSAKAGDKPDLAPASTEFKLTVKSK